MAMTREQKEAVLIGFYLDGKQVQYRPMGEAAFNDIAATCRPTWEFEEFEFRLKPEPVEGWFVVCGNGDLMRVYGNPQRVGGFYMRECDPPESTP